MKKCRGCGLKPESDFGRNKSKNDGLQDYCKPCNNELCRLYYASSKSVRDKCRERSRARKEQGQKLIWDYLKTHPCIDCGESDPVILEFDHVRGTKFKNVADMPKNFYSLITIEKEIKKCDVRCCNCHRRRTYLEANSWRTNM